MPTTYELYTNENGTPKAVEGKAPAIIERVETIEETLANEVVTSVNDETGEVYVKKLIMGEHVLELKKDGTLKLDENLVITSAGGSFVNPVSFKAGIDLSATGQTEYGDVQFLCDKNGKTAFGIQLSKWADGGSAFRLIPYSVAGAQLPLFALDRSKGNSISCTIAGKEVERVNSRGTNWIRYESGIQICWGFVTIYTSNTVCTLPVAFSDKNYILQISSSYGTSEPTSNPTVINTFGRTSSSSFTARGNYQNTAEFIAIGRWK